MIRRLLLLCALVALSNFAYGLGLGELELRSGLNQQFEAEIELTNIRDLEIDEILPGLATQADFERVGIERDYLLTDLRFRVVPRDDGRLVVRITSTRPIIEPFLNFIVEVLWPSGRILREYTVLLDPPVFGEEGVQRLQPAQSQQQSQQLMAPRTAPAQQQSQQQRLEEGTYASGEYGTTGPGDTLWAIALKTRPNESVSVQQMMLALQRENPEAFINNNINLLKAGYVLRIPDMDDIRRQSVSSAIAEVRAQNEAFEAYRGRPQVAQLDATPRERRDSGGTGSAQEGELRLLAAGGEAGTRAGSGGSMRDPQLENELAVAKEDLDRARRANSELNSRISDLEAQLATMDEMIKLKEDQLATLRASVQRMQAESEAAPVAQQPTQTASSGSLLTNPFVLGALALLVIGGAAGGLFYMRRRGEADGFEEDVFDGLQVAEEDAEPEDEAGSADVGLEEEEEEETQDSEDVLSEAEIYIAYGRFPQAITFLQNAIESEPNRADIQLKLLEVYVQTEDATAFNLQYEQLKLLEDDDAVAQAAALQAKIPGAAETAEAAMDATIVASEPIAAIDEPEDDDDLSFDLDDLDAETEDDALDLDLDDAEEMDLDLDGAEEEISLDGEELDLDLEADSTEEDLEIDLDADDGLDLDLDGGDEEDDTLVMESPITAEDDDLDLDFGEDDLEIDLDSADDDDAISLDLETDDDDAISLDLDADADDDGISLDLDDDDGAISLDLEDDDDAISLDLDDDDDVISLDLDDAELDDADLESELKAAVGDDELDLDLDNDDTVELDLGEDTLDLDDDALSLDDGDDTIELNLDDDDDLNLGGDDDALGLDLDDDDDLELNLDEDASTKLDLARAYIDMGDSDGARKTLEEVIKEGSEDEVQEANELLSKID